jgi:hypothetical protein
VVGSSSAAVPRSRSECIAVDIIAGVEAHFGHADAAERLLAQETLQDEAQRSQMGALGAGRRALERHHILDLGLGLVRDHGDPLFAGRCEALGGVPYAGGLLDLERAGAPPGWWKWWTDGGTIPEVPCWLGRPLAP